VTVIGKVSQGRGFELALETFALLRKRVAGIHFMIIGHGEHRPALETMASELAVDDRLVWAGYHEDDLADHYRASTILLFTASGSDEGHRAVLEAMACGAVPIVVPLEGIDALVDRSHIASSASATALADTVVATFDRDLNAIRARLAERCERFSYRVAAERLRDGEELGDIIDDLFARKESKRQAGAICILTGGAMSRTDAFAYLVAMACAPFLHPDLY